MILFPVFLKNNFIYTLLIPITAIYLIVFIAD